MLRKKLEHDGAPGEHVRIHGRSVERRAPKRRERLFEQRARSARRRDAGFRRATTDFEERDERGGKD
jgi:hypothetical protein